MKQIFIRSRYYFFTVCFFLVFHHGNLLACSCIAPRPPGEEYQKSDAVFLGSVDTIIVESDIGGWMRVVFEVKKSWKGIPSETTFIYTPFGVTACRYEFDKGSTYLVYAYRRNDTLYTNSCWRTRLEVNAAEDLAYLATLGVKEIPGGAGIPFLYRLFQNYPNPANPGTTFRFEVPNAAFVNLSLYNPLGQKVAEIFSGFMYEGGKEINWNCSHIPSGVYIAQLRSKHGTKSVKTIILK